MALHSIKVEQHVLGGLIQNPDVLTEVEPFLNEKAFIVKPHDIIYSCLRSLVLGGEKIDKVLLAQRIDNLGIKMKGDLTIFDYIESISLPPITPKATIEAAKEVVKFYALREIDGTCDEIKKHIQKSVNQDFEKTIIEVDGLYGQKINSFELSNEPENLFGDIYELVEQTRNNITEETGLIWPYPEFNRLYGGARGGNIYAFASPPAQGKALEENTLIPTPNGFTKIKDLNVGDYVFNPNGEPTKVTNIARWKNRRIHKVTTCDKQSVWADENHEWVVKRVFDRKKEILETKFLFKNPLTEGKRPILEMHSALNLPYKNLDIDPYILGVWLGDGHSCGTTITSTDDYIIKQWENYGVVLGLKMVNFDTISYRLINKKGKSNILKEKLKSLNLINNKHIPNEYLWASKEQRLQILQGLLDTDGYINPTDGTVEFCSKNENLATGVMHLVHSLGGKASLSKNKSFLYKKDCGFRFRVRFHLENCFQLQRKNQFAVKLKRNKNRHLSVSEEKMGNTVCIEVEDSSHMFLCGTGMIPTHNSTFLGYTSMEMGKINQCPVLILDTELMTKEVKFRSAAAFSGVPLYYLETGNWSKNPEFVEKVRKHLKNIKDRNKVYHYHVGNKNVDEIVSLIRRWYLSVVGRGNKCVVVYDYLKLTGEKLSAFWAEHQALGEKVDKLKRISEEYDFPLLTAIQTNRSGENNNRSSQDIADNGTAIAQTSRLQWFCTYLGIFRRRTEDEMIVDTKESGTHKLIEVKARYQGKNAAGHNDFIKRVFPDGKERYVRNFINFNIDNFKVEERGSLKDCIARQNAQFKIEDVKDKKEYILESETL